MEPMLPLTLKDTSFLVLIGFSSQGVVGNIRVEKIVRKEKPELMPNAPTSTIMPQPIPNLAPGNGENGP